METFSTVLFMDHAPVGYRVQKTPGRLELYPAQNHMRTETHPRLIAEKWNGEWHVQGTENKEIIRQLLDEIYILEQKTPHPVLSAAP